jgi:DNA-binding response OmpR family regulator
MSERELTHAQDLRAQHRRMSTVVVVGGEPDVRDAVARYLSRDGYRTLEAADGEEARRILEWESASLVVLDVTLPGIGGLALCRWIRSRSVTPVILLTALEETDRMAGLELGADDYITKPFSPRELSMRVRDVLRRTEPAPTAGERYEFGDVTLEPGARDVRKRGVRLKLTLKEFDLLHTLLSHPRRVFTREELMDRVWGYHAALETGTLTVHVRRLREKLEDDPSRPRFLETVWGTGYRFVP